MAGAKRLDFDDTGFQQAVLHGRMSFSIPSARYTDKADGITKNARSPFPGQRAEKRY
jgi:hypothetical protein